MDYAALHTELTTDPEALGYADLLNAKDDAGLAVLLNAKSYPGYVPINELAAYCCAQGITGGVMALAEIPIGATDNPPTSLSVATKGMLHTVMTLIQIDFRLESADVNDPKFGAACDGLVALNAMSPAQKTALVALGDNRRSRAEQVLGDGVFVTAADAEAARKGNA